MYIFTPRRIFDHRLVETIGVLPAVRGTTPPTPARISVRITGEVFILEGAEAFDVLRQMEKAGIFTSDEHSAVVAALRDEMEMEAVAGLSDEDLRSLL